MPLRRYVSSLVPIALSALGMALLIGCSKEPVRVDRNRPPRTFLVAAPPESASSSYRVHLYWRGEDPDGFITGYAWSFDRDEINAYRFTTRTDSTFDLTVNDSADIAGGSQIAGLSRYHTFFVRAIDNLGKPDANPAFFNRRIFNAATLAPRVRFLAGPDVNGVGGDTLSDGQKFRICWTGNDSDGVVRFFKVDVGPHSTPLSSDTCAFFNDNVPGALGLVSGAYVMSVTAVDNAYAIGRERYGFVVNHDPETWFLPRSAPIGHYIRPFLEGHEVNQSGTFAQGDTVPYRSTVWFDWDGSDTEGGELDCLTGWTLTLRGGSRLGPPGDPYTIGFLDTLATSPSVVRFKTNNPVTMGLVGFNNLILDSLDASYNMDMIVAAKDCSGRPDGTDTDSNPVSKFRFNCNFPPRLNSLTHRDTVAVAPHFPGFGSEPCKVIEWATYDNEDGITKNATVRLDLIQNVVLNNWEQMLLVPYRVYRQLGQTTTHRADVFVSDRADIEAKNTMSVTFQIP